MGILDKMSRKIIIIIIIIIIINGARTEMGYCPNCVVTKGLGSWALGAGARGMELGAHAEACRGAERRRELRRTPGVCGIGAGRAAWACCWPTGCALGALGALSLF